MFETSTCHWSLVASHIEKNKSDSSESKLSVALFINNFRFSSSFSMSIRMLEDFDFFIFGGDRGVVDEWKGNLRFPRLTPFMSRDLKIDGFLLGVSTIGLATSGSKSSSSDDRKSSSSIISSCEISAWLFKMFMRTGIAGVSSIFKSLLASFSIGLIKALDEVAVASLPDVDEVDKDVEGVSMTCGGFSSGMGELIVDEMGL